MPTLTTWSSGTIAGQVVTTPPTLERDLVEALTKLGSPKYRAREVARQVAQAGCQDFESGLRAALNLYRTSC